MKTKRNCKIVYVSHSKSGFTLFEVIVASVLSAFIALVAAGGLRGVISARSSIDQTLEVGDQLRYATNQMRADLLDVYRRKTGFLFEGLAGDITVGENPTVRFHAVRSVNARPDMAESDLYEIEYFIFEQDGKSWFCKRLCPVVGNEQELEDEDGGAQGILIKLAENVGLFAVRYYDGSEWTDEWLLDNESLPVMLEVSILATLGDEQQDQDEPELLAKQFWVHFSGLEPEDSVSMDMDMSAEETEE